MTPEQKKELAEKCVRTYMTNLTSTWYHKAWAALMLLGVLSTPFIGLFSLVIIAAAGYCGHQATEIAYARSMNDLIPSKEIV